MLRRRNVGMVWASLALAAATAAAPAAPPSPPPDGTLLELRAATYCS